MIDLETLAEKALAALLVIVGWTLMVLFLGAWVHATALLFMVGWRVF